MLAGPDVILGRGLVLPRVAAVLPAGHLAGRTRPPDVGGRTDREETRRRLEGFRRRWPEIRARLAEQLVPAAEIERRLRVVGAPATPEEIGSTVAASLADVRRTIYMRDRFMALDFLDLTGQLDDFAARAFA